jgi:hypothetical protein
MASVTSACAERAANRYLGAARHRLREQEVRVVAAGDEQHDRRGAKQHVEPSTKVAYEIFTERGRDDAAVVKRMGILLREARIDLLELPDRHGRRDSAPDQAVDIEFVVLEITRARRCWSERNP